MCNSADFLVNKIREYPVVVATVGEGVLDAVLWALREKTELRSVILCRGKKMRTEIGLFDEFSAAYQFPYYFGENWPAFDECINDLSWVSSDGFILVVQNAEQILVDDNVNNCKYFLNLINETVNAWKNGENTECGEGVINFSVIFNCDMGHAEQTKNFVDLVRVAIPNACFLSGPDGAR